MRVDVFRMSNVFDIKSVGICVKARAIRLFNVYVSKQNVVKYEDIDLD